MGVLERQQTWQWQWISDIIGAGSFEPGARTSYIWVYDSVRQYSILNGSSINGEDETFKIDHVTGTMSDTGSPLHKFDASGYWDPVGRRILQSFGGYHTGGPGSTYETMEWNDNTQAWADVTHPSTPTSKLPRLKTSVGVVEATGKAYVYSGEVPGYYTGGTWEQTLSSLLFQEINPLPEPDDEVAMEWGRRWTSTAWCPTDGAIYIIGGQQTAAPFTDRKEIWRLAPDLSGWADVTPSGITNHFTYSPRKPIFVWMPGVQAFVVIGGNAGGPTIEDTEVSIFEPISGTWLDISSRVINDPNPSAPNSGNPGRKAHGAGFYDPNLDLIFVGPGDTSNPAGFWTLTPAAAPSAAAVDGFRGRIYPMIQGGVREMDERRRHE